MVRVMLMAWVLVVGAVTVANAQDSSLVLAPEGCNIKVATVVRLHTELCKSDAECTQRLMDTMCVLAPKAVER